MRFSLCLHVALKKHAVYMQYGTDAKSIIVVGGLLVDCTTVEAGFVNKLWELMTIVEFSFVYMNFGLTIIPSVCIFFFLSLLPKNG